MLPEAVLAAEPVPRLVITGADESIEDNLRAHLRLPTEKCSASVGRLQRSLPALRRSGTDALNALGYYHARLGTSFAKQDDCWQLLVDVSPGEPVRYRNVAMTISGDQPAQALFAPLLAKSAVQSGAVLHHGAYEALKDVLGSTAADNGYFDARFTETVIALDLPAHAADVTLGFEPGQRYRFGPLRITNPGILSESLIFGMLPLGQGEPYAADKLVKMRAALDKSQYFNQIRVAPLLRQSQDREVPIELTLGMRPRHAWTGGLGFTTDTGPRTRLRYENRYLNSSGHRLAADSSFSQIRAQLDGSYSIPLNHRLADQVIFTAGYVIENNATYDSKRLLTGISLPRENASGWQQNVTLDLQRDDYRFPSYEDVSVLVLPGFSVTKSRADDLINPTHGWKLQASLKGSSDTLLSDTTFLQFYSTAKLVRSIGPLRMLGRAELGSTWIDVTQELPASLQYFAGGDQSVRGFDFRALGPLDAAGEVSGGKHLAVASIEFDYRVLSKWRVAFFTDAGNAFDDKQNMDVRYSAGIGLRWQSPIGPLRFDIAHPFDAEENFRIHVTMGPDL